MALRLREVEAPAEPPASLSIVEPDCDETVVLQAELRLIDEDIAHRRFVRPVLDHAVLSASRILGGLPKPPEHETRTVTEPDAGLELKARR